MCECEWPTRMHWCIVVYVVCATHRQLIYTPAGISPWKIGMLAANLFLWDIMWKRIQVPSYQEEWQVQADQIERAYALMTVFAKIRTTYTTHMPITCMLCMLCGPSHTSIAYHRRGVVRYIECVVMRTSYSMFTSQDRILEGQRRDYRSATTAGIRRPQCPRPEHSATSGLHPHRVLPQARPPRQRLAGRTQSLTDLRP